jgi:DNA-directed RNA polymerase specialized sigma subunit
MEKGSELALALRPLMPLAEVGVKLGISAAMVSRIERRALVKIEHAMKQHARELGYRR